MTAEAMAVDVVARGRRRLGTWTAVLLLVVVGLGAFVWAGGGADPRLGVPWTWTRKGWLVPARGLGNLWLAAAGLYVLLSVMAWFLFHPVAGRWRLKPWANAAMILVLAGLVRIGIAAQWIPLPLDEAALSMKILPAASGWRWAAAGVDVGVIGLLLVILAGRGRSLWWAALYAFHPLVLLEVAGNGSWACAGAAALVFAAGLSHRMGRGVRMGIGILAAAAMVAAAAVMGANAMRGGGFNSLGFACASLIGAHGWGVLVLAAAIGEGAVIWVSMKGDWSLARTLGHVLVVGLICSPVVEPWAVVAVTALVPLAWMRAGWVLSLAVMGAYIAALRGHHGDVPVWWFMLEWIPVMVLELEELWRDGWGMLEARTAFLS